jgi:nicotinamidase-related amidase
VKKCLIIVDYQNDFVCGSLGFEKARSLDEKIAAKAEEYRKDGGDVIFTFDTHGEDYLETREGKFLPVKHCIRGSEGHLLYGVTGEQKKETDLCFEKGSFGSDKLYEYLKKNKYDLIELCGVVTNICVISNAILAKTAQPECDVVVDKACVASNDETLNEAALKVMASLQIEIDDGNEE